MTTDTKFMLLTAVPFVMAVVNIPFAIGGSSINIVAAGVCFACGVFNLLLWLDSRGR